MGIRNKRILITAGATWVAIDEVRVISNIASGETGILLADELSKKGARVTLLLGQGDCGYRGRGVKTVRFRFFEELRRALEKELKASRYDFIIHSAAVSDFGPQNPAKGKLKSKGPYTLKLKTLPKLSAQIRKLAPKAGIVLFKLECGIKDEQLIRRGRTALVSAGADLVVANRLKPRYRAYILDHEQIFCRVDSKKDMVGNLVRLMEIMSER